MSPTRLKQEYWGRELQDDLPRASFKELLCDDAVLLTLLENVETLGVVLVSDVPPQLGQINRLMKRIGHVKPTHYGLVFKSTVLCINICKNQDFLACYTNLYFSRWPETYSVAVIMKLNI